VILSGELGREVSPRPDECEMTTTVAQLLNQKGHNVEAIAPGATVYDAIKRMSDLDIGALVVLDEGRD
jgi:CBS domain-containing protein